MNTLDTLHSVYKLVLEKSTDEAVDVLFKHVDELLTEEQFEQCNAFLQEVNLQRLDTNLVVALISVTRAAKEKLPYRTAFLACAEARLIQLAPERAERLRGPE